MSSAIVEYARQLRAKMNAERGLMRIINTGIALTSAAIICAATRPDIAAAFIKLMTGGK